MQLLEYLLKWVAYLLQLVSHWFSAYRKLMRIQEVAERVLDGEPFWLRSEELIRLDELAAGLAKSEGSSIPFASAQFAMENAAAWLDDVIDHPIHPNDQAI